MSASELTAARVIAAGLYLLPTLAWGSIAVVAWRNVLRRRPGAVIWLVVALTALTALYYGVGALLRLVPPDGVGPLAPGRLSTLRDLIVAVSVAISQHMLRLFPPWEVRTPRPRWLVANYGIAALVAVILLFPDAIPGPAPDRWLASRVILVVYFLAAGVLGSRQLARVARRGAWQPGGLGEIRSPDVIMSLTGVAFVGVTVVRWTVGETAVAPTWVAAAEMAIAILSILPFAMRFLAEGTRLFLSAVVLLAAAGAVLVGGRLLVPPGLERDLVTVLGLVLVLVPGRSWLRRAVDRIVFRHSRQRRAEMQALLHGLSPELGVLECCRRCLAASLPIMQLRGAAILLHDGEAIACGAFALEAVRPVWPRGEERRLLPMHAFGGPEFHDLPVAQREAMNEANVVGVLPIVSPRRHWGDLLATAGMLTAIYSEEDVQAWEGFAAQFALLLDAADLIARAVAVERSLAHAEKLAAIGEVSARIAHEIRNPVTAARSLAQQLAREPASPVAAELGVILEELARVERQVAALLRFARREEFRFEPVDLSALTHATVAALRGRLDAAGIEVALEAAEGVTARADREKIRQVLVNLIENATDALAEVAGSRRLGIAVTGADGVAMLRVTDTGPGVPADALPHLFEPFFSLKDKGTGLGLAIAWRIVQAHGGRIEVRSDGAGTTFALALPAAR